MAIYEYAQQFFQQLQQKYARESCSDDLTKSNLGVQFMNAQTIKLPRISMGGFKDHTRTPGFNAQVMSNDWEPKKLEFDRDAEFFIDPMDIDETNVVLSIANIQNTFETEQAIPEKDCYRFSKIHTEFTAFGGTVDNTIITTENVLEVFDEMMERMDEEGVPEEGRIIYATPTFHRILKSAQGVQRNITVNTANGINRKVHSLDDVKIKSVPSSRMKTVYDFTDGCTAAVGAKQINMILLHPTAIICREKYAYMKLFTPGTDSRTADGYLYQIRNYGDLFLLEKKVPGVSINVEV